MIVAGVLALTGALLLVNYVSNADARAQAAEAAVPTLVVRSEIAQGTPAGQLSTMVSVVDVPARLVAPDAVTDLAQLEGLVTKSTLYPGEQVLTGRFAAAGSPDTAPKQDGKEYVSLTLEPQRAVGGALGEGDVVDVYVTSMNADTAALASRKVVEGVTVFRVDGGLASAGIDSSGPIGEAVGSAVTVTLALDPAHVPDVVAGMETDLVWLSRTGSSAETTVTTTSGDTK